MTAAFGLALMVGLRLVTVLTGYNLVGLAKAFLSFGVDANGISVSCSSRPQLRILTGPRMMATDGWVALTDI